MTTAGAFSAEDRLWADGAHATVYFDGKIVADGIPATQFGKQLGGT